MFSNVLSATAVALAITQLVSAQTFTDCNPLEKTCPDNPALGKTVTVDFTRGKSDLFAEAMGTTVTYDNSLGARFNIVAETGAPTISSTKYIFFGKVDVIARASQGVGVVTSFVLQSADLDEIDWEWLGGDKSQVQTNYFGKGDTTTYDRGAYHAVINPQDEFHKYTIDWTKDYIKWYINDNLVRTLNFADAQQGTRFPQTPMQIKLGTWVAGGRNSPKGTVEWAGGYTDFSLAPFDAYYKSVTIEDYSIGASSYQWTDNTGSYQSIRIVKADSSKDATTTSQSSSSTADATGSSKQGSTTTLGSATRAAPITQVTALGSADNSSSSSVSIPSGTASEVGVAASATAMALSTATVAPHSTASDRTAVNVMALIATVVLALLAL